MKIFEIMANYNEQLNILFDKWETESNKNGETAFCRDGLMYKYGRDKNYVDELWGKSQKRIMFLLKDPKEESGDSREWLYYESNRQLQAQFIRKLACLLYGLSTAKNGKTVDFSAITNEQIVSCFDETPFAFVESKKQAGTTTIKDKELDKYINRYKEYLTEEINILNPNIIVCCGGPQYHFALTDLCKNAEIIDKNIHFHKESNTLLIYSYHPSARTSYESFYNEVMRQYEQFLAKYSDSELK
jgi:hypothetical protein